MVDTLIRCNFDNVKKVINVEVVDVAWRDEMFKQISHVKEYLK